MKLTDDVVIGGGDEGIDPNHIHKVRYGQRFEILNRNIFEQALRIVFNMKAQ